MFRYVTVVSFSVLLLVPACNVNVPFDPSEVGQPINEFFEDAQNAIEGAVADPLGAKPFPVIVGGDSERVFYATSLSDVRLNFPGPTNDVVFPSFIGPSNLYKFEQRERSLVQPLIPSGAFANMATDGDFVAYVIAPDLNSSGQVLHVLDLFSGYDSALFDGTADAGAVLYGQRLEVNGGRIVFAILDVDSQTPRLHVEDLAASEPAVEIETATNFSTFDLLGNRLAYIEGRDEGPRQVVLRDLGTGETQIIAEGIRVNAPWQAASLVQSPNAIIWTEPTGDDEVSRVMRYDVFTGLTRVWSDAARGSLVGATDEHFVTEELDYRLPDQTNQVIVRRFDSAGGQRKLATFRADGLAGQTTVVGNRAAWVNPERKIVLAPLSGGDRTIFRPF